MVKEITKERGDKSCYGLPVHQAAVDGRRGEQSTITGGGEDKGGEQRATNDGAVDKGGEHSATAGGGGNASGA